MPKVDLRVCPKVVDVASVSRVVVCSICRPFHWVCPWLSFHYHERVNSLQLAAGFSVGLSSSGGVRQAQPTGSQASYAIPNLVKQVVSVCRLQTLMIL